jgi:outer membrane protein OmpA-like peptidoglycan-associated protein
VNDSDWKPKKLPPDDFSKTTPNIRIPREDLPPPREDFSNDWEKTNYNYSPKQSPPVDDWEKTSHNINAPRHQPNDDWGKTFIPGQKSNNSNNNDDWGKTMAPGRQPNNTNWGATQNSINFNQDDFGGGGGRRQENNHTMPYFRLPDAEREKYQNIPPTPTEAKAAEEKEQEKKGGVPGWLWASAGLGAMFIFALVVFLGVWYFFFKTNGFDVVVKGPQPGSQTFVDGERWGVTLPDGSIELRNVKAGQRKIIIKNNDFEDDVKDVTGADGDSKEVTAMQKRKEVVQPPNLECKGPFNPGQEALAAKCANEGLDKLGEDFSVQDLLNAMNLYIIKFDVNLYNIKDQDKAFLLKAAGYMKKLAAKAPNVKIEVGGHTDNAGTDAKNQPLSENRAKAVYDFLIKQGGVNAAMLETRGYGSKSPKVPNDTPEHKFQNRRIEYKAVMASN